MKNNKELEEKELTAEATPPPQEGKATAPPTEPPQEPTTTETPPTDEQPPQEENTGNEVDAILAEFMPDADISSPEAREAAIGQLLGRLVNIQNSLRDVVEDEPEFGMVLNDILKGGKVATAFAKHYGPDAFSEPEEGDPDYEEYGKVKENRTKTRQEKEQRRKALKQNEEVSMQEIDSYMEEKGLSPEQAQDFFAKADEFFKDIFDGKITKNHLAMLEKAFGYENAVTEAKETGKVEGRNEKIVEEKVKKPVTSGLPEINEGGTPQPAAKRKTGLLDELYSQQS